ncbi:MAG: GAF domain-containing protein [Myxococcota bacterium]
MAHGDVPSRAATSAVEARLRVQNAAVARLARSGVLHTGDLCAALRALTEAAAEVMDVARVSFWVRADAEHITCLDLWDRVERRHTEGASLRASDCPAYFAALDAARFIDASDAQGDPRTCELREGYLAALGITSMLDAPVLLGGRSVGVVCHEHRGPPRAWTVDEEQFAATIADLVAQALEARARVRAEARLRDALARERLLARVSRDLAEATLDLPRTLDTIVRTTAEGLRAGCLLRLLSDDGAHLVPAAWWTLEPRLVDVLARAYARGSAVADEPLAQEALRTGKPLLRDVTRADAPEGHPFAEVLRVSGPRHLGLFPLVVHGRPIGLLGLARPAAVAPFSIDEVKLVTELADRAALAIDHTRLVAADRRAREAAESAEHRAQAYAALLGGLREVTRALDEAGLVADAALVAFVTAATRSLCRACVVRLLSPDGKRLVTMWLGHRDAERLAAMRDAVEADLPTGAGVVAEVLASGQPRVIPAGGPDLDLLVPPACAEHLRASGLADVLFAPIRVRGETLGIAAFGADARDPPFDDARVDILTDATYRAALALDNAALMARERDARAAAEGARDEVRRLAEALEARVAERTAHLTALVEELESLAYSISHDLRSPLRAIDGFAVILTEDYAKVLDEQGQRALQRIRAAVAGMARLIEELLDLSRATRQPLVPGDVDLAEAARDAIAALRRREPTRVVEFTCVPSAPARGDPQLVRFAVKELVANAWKFTAPVPDARIEFGVSGRNGDTAWFVRDNGVGFDPAFADRLFRPLHRLHPQGAFEGTGIGLATIARIVRRHGGRIWADGSPGRGATFWFTLGGG